MLLLKTSSQVNLTLSFQQFRANRIIKPSTPSANPFKQTRGQLALTWVEALWDTWDSFSDASYAMISPATDTGPTLWISPQSPGRAPANTDGTAAQISAARHIWEEDVQTYRSYTSVQQALKKQIISVFEPMYLDVLNDNMVGFTNISARDMLDHLFGTYGNITAVDLEINFEHMS
jgi:hypothetical protein